MLLGLVGPLAAVGIVPSLQTHLAARPKLSLGGTKMLGNLFSSAFQKREINYEALAGLPASFGREAAEYALKGEVPVKSKDGWEVATFAGGKFSAPCR